MFRDDNRPYRVAFSDIDGTLLIKDAQGRHVLNPAVVEKLREYDEVNLFTQRGKFVLRDKQSEVPYGEAFTREVEEKIDHAQIAYVLDELQKALPGKNIKVSTSLDPFFNGGEVGAYYEQQVRAYEAKLAQAAKAKCASFDGTGRQLLASEDLKVLEDGLKAEAEAEIADILKNPDMLKKCYEQLKQRMDPKVKENTSFRNQSGYERIIGVMNSYFVENGVLGADDVGLKTDEAREVFYDFLLSLEEDNDLLRSLLERLIKDKIFLSPLQDKMGHYDSASRQIQRQHPDREVEFTIFEDSGLNLAEIDSMDFGDRQPVGVLVVEGLGVNTSSAHVKHLTKSEIDERAVQRAAMSTEERQQIASAVLRESKGGDSLPSRETLTKTFAEVGRLLTGDVLLKKLDKKGVFSGGTKITVGAHSYHVSKNLAHVIQCMMGGMDAVNALQKKPEQKLKAEWSCLCDMHKISKNWLEALSSQRLKGVNFQNLSPEAIARKILNGNFDVAHKLHAQLFLMLNPLAKGQGNGMNYNFIEMEKQLQVFQETFGGNAPALDQPMKEASTATGKMMQAFAATPPLQAPKSPTKHDGTLSEFYETLSSGLQNVEFFKKLEAKRFGGKSVKVGGETKRIPDTLAEMILLLQKNKGEMDGAKKQEIVKEIFMKSRGWLQDNAPDILQGQRRSSDPLLVAENIIGRAQRGEVVREEHVMHAAIFHVLQPKLEPRDTHADKQSSARSLKEAFTILCDSSARSTYDASKRFSGSFSRTNSSSGSRSSSSDALRIIRPADGEQPKPPPSPGRHK